MSAMALISTVNGRAGGRVAAGSGGMARARRTKKPDLARASIRPRSSSVR
jgi:hypothetical protein